MLLDPNLMHVSSYLSFCIIPLTPSSIASFLVFSFEVSFLFSFPSRQSYYCASVVYVMHIVFVVVDFVTRPLAVNMVVSRQLTIMNTTTTSLLPGWPTNIAIARSLCCCLLRRAAACLRHIMAAILVWLSSVRTTLRRVQAFR